MLPKYISKKVDKLEKLLYLALSEKRDIERWGEKKGIDTSSHEWHDNVIDDISGVRGICKDGLCKILEGIRSHSEKEEDI